MAEVVDFKGQTIHERQERLKAAATLKRAQDHKHGFKHDVLVLGMDDDGRIHYTTNMTNGELMWAIEKLKFVVFSELDEVQPDEGN